MDLAERLGRLVVLVSLHEPEPLQVRGSAASSVAEEISSRSAGAPRFVRDDGASGPRIGAGSAGRRCVTVASRYRDQDAQHQSETDS